MKIQVAPCGYCRNTPVLDRKGVDFKIYCKRGDHDRTCVGVSWTDVAELWNAGNRDYCELNTQDIDCKSDGYSVQTTMETPKMSAVKIEHVATIGVRLNTLDYGQFFYPSSGAPSRLFQLIEGPKFIDTETGKVVHMNHESLAFPVRVKIIVEGFAS